MTVTSDKSGFIKCNYTFENYSSYTPYLPSSNYINKNTTIMVYAKNSVYTNIQLGGSNYYITFPQEGLYYLYLNENFYLKNINYFEYFKITSDNYQANWNQENPNHPGYIKNKPLLYTKNDID
jgi:hypothetical protein